MDYLVNMLMDDTFINIVRVSVAFILGLVWDM